MKAGGGAKSVHEKRGREEAAVRLAEKAGRCCQLTMLPVNPVQSNGF